MTRDQHLRYIPNLDPSSKKINVIARLEAFVNNPNIKAIASLHMKEALLYYLKKQNQT
jgi:hypothetical protein